MTSMTLDSDMNLPIATFIIALVLVVLLVMAFNRWLARRRSQAKADRNRVNRRNSLWRWKRQPGRSWMGRRGAHRHRPANLK